MAPASGAQALTALEKVCNSAAKKGNKNKWDEQIAACTALLQSKTDDKTRHLYFSNRAYAFQDKKDCEAAAADLTSALELVPPRSREAYDLYLRRGFVWKSCKGDTASALADLESAILIAPARDEPDLRNDRASFLHQLGQLDKAMVEINAAIGQRPNTASYYNIRAQIWKDKGELDTAIDEYSKSISINPRYGNAYSNRGEAWRLKGDLARAEADLSKAVSLEPKSPLFRTYRANTRRYGGRVDDAMRDLDEAIRLFPDFAFAYTSRGLTHERKGKPDAARADYLKALTFPDVYDTTPEAKDTARARLAALDSGEAIPIIPPTPIKATNATSVPTPAIAADVLVKPLDPGRLQSTASLRGRRVALVIGNSAYRQVGPLSNPKNDAGAVAAALRNIGFDTVSVAPDSTKDALIAALQAFAQEADKADWAMVYYAGHGIEVNGKNYLIPVDATLKTDRDVQFETVPMDQVMSTIDGARKLKLILLDACRDNPFAPNMEKTGVRDVVQSTAGGAVGTRSIGRGLGEMKVAGASLVVFAAKHGQTALDGEGANSPFAVALVQRIATPGVEINKIFRLVRDDVMEATAGRQEPYTYGSLPGKEDFFFVAAK